MFEGQNIVCLALETLHTEDDCRHCGKPKEAHTIPSAYCIQMGPSADTAKLEQFAAIGWDNKAALGLGIGCYWDCRDSRVHWFDTGTLEDTVRFLLDTQPLLISFNGQSHDFQIMLAMLRQTAERIRLNDVPPGQEAPTIDHAADREGALLDICEAFQSLCASSYDILVEIWKIDPPSHFARGVHSMNAISMANGLGQRLWRRGQSLRTWADAPFADALNACQDDALRIKALFALVATGQPLLLGDGRPITLPLPPGWPKETSR